jgi:hypothetical protein
VAQTSPTQEAESDLAGEHTAKSKQTADAPSYPKTGGNADDQKYQGCGADDAGSSAHRDGGCHT